LVVGGFVFFTIWGKVQSYQTWGNVFGPLIYLLLMMVFVGTFVVEIVRNIRQGEEKMKPDRSRQKGARAFFVSALVILSVTFAPAAHAGVLDQNMDALTEEQARLANEMLEFVASMEEKLWGVVEELHGNAELEVKEVDDESADYVIKAARGDVIAKALFMTNVTRQAIPPYMRDSVWNRYIKIDIYPKSPLVGKLHLTLNFVIGTDGGSSLGGWMDTIPATWNDEDIDTMRDVIDEIFVRYDVDVAPYRELVCVGDPEEIDRRYRRKPACSGASFYNRPGQPPPFEVNDTNFQFITETFETMFDVYIGTLKARKDQPYTEEDVATQDAMHKRGLEDGLMSDPVVRDLIPPAVWILSNTPPSVKF